MLGDPHFTPYKNFVQILFTLQQVRVRYTNNFHSYLRIGQQHCMNLSNIVLIFPGYTALIF